MYTPTHRRYHSMPLFTEETIKKIASYYSPFGIEHLFVKNWKLLFDKDPVSL